MRNLHLKVVVLLLLATFSLLCLHTEAKVLVHCRLPDVDAPPAQGTTRQFVEYCPEEAWPRGVGNTLIYYPIVFWFAVFTGRDLSITDLSSVGSVCRIFHCGFPFTSDMKKKFPDLKLSNSPRKVNYNLVQYFAGNKHLKNDIININGYAAHLFPSFLGSVTNASACAKQLAPHCSIKDYSCLENFAYRQHFLGGFRNDSMLPASVVGLSDSARQNLVSPLPPAPAPARDPPLPISNSSPNSPDTTPLPPPTSTLSPTPKTFHVGIHIRAQLNSLEHKNNNASLSTANFNLYNNSIFPHFNNYLTYRFYNPRDGLGGSSSSSSGDKVTVDEAVAARSPVPPRVFVSVDDIELKRLLLLHLQTYRDPLQPVHLTYVNNSRPIKHAKHMGGGATAAKKKTSHTAAVSSADSEMVPTMFDWYGLSQAEFILSYRLWRRVKLREGEERRREREREGGASNERVALCSCSMPL